MVRAAQKVYYLSDFIVEPAGQFGSFRPHNVLISCIKLLGALGSSRHVDDLIIATISQVYVIPVRLGDKVQPGLCRHVCKATLLTEIGK